MCVCLCVFVHMCMHVPCVHVFMCVALSAFERYYNQDIKDYTI